MPARPRQSGMTLVEALIALALLAILSGMAWRGLDAALRAADAETRSTRDDERLRLALLIVERDLATLRGRLAFADAPAPLTSDGRHLLLQGDDGSTLYRLHDGRLERVRQAAAGDAQARQPLAALASLSFRFADDAGQWHPRWPAGALPLPAGVEITLAVAAERPVQRLWLLRP